MEIEQALCLQYIVLLDEIAGQTKTSHNEMFSFAITLDLLVDQHRLT